MSAPTRMEGDVHVAGALTCTSMGIPSGTVVDDDVAAGADIAATKLQQQYQKVYAQESDTDAADESRVIHCVYGATGTIIGFEAGSVVVATGTDTCTVDLEKDGVSVLVAPITLDNGNAAFTPEAGTIDTAAVVNGDVLEVVIDMTAGDGTKAKGVYCSLIIREDPA